MIFEIICLIVTFLCSTVGFQLHSHPVKLTGIEFDKIRPDNMLNKISGRTLRYVYESESPIFPYYDTSLSAKYSTFHSDFTFVNVTIDNICDTTSAVFRYYSGNLFQPEFSDVHELLHPKSIFKVKFVDKVSTNMWIGSAGVKATTHYDNVHNIYIQLSGTKQFRLLAPNQAKELLLYGRHHPYSCQSRLEDMITGTRFNREELDVFHDLHHKYDVTGAENFQTESRVDPSDSFCHESYDSKEVIEIILHPGDVLLIPAFWFHEATALTCSKSVSYWWDSPALDIMDDVYALPLPIESNWTPLRKTATIFLFVDALISKLEMLHGRITGKEGHLLMDLLKNRYLNDRITFEHSSNRSRLAVMTADIMDQMKHLRMSEPDLIDKIAVLVTESYMPVFERFRNGASLAVNLKEVLKTEEFSTKRIPKSAFMGACGVGDAEEECSIEELDALQDSAAVMSIKAADYIEDVLLHLSSDSQVDFSYPEAVLLLLQYINIAESKGT